MITLCTCGWIDEAPQWIEGFISNCENTITDFYIVPLFKQNSVARLARIFYWYIPVSEDRFTYPYLVSRVLIASPFINLILAKLKL